SWARRRLCSWMFSGYVLCMSPQRRMNFIRDRYAKKWLVMPRGQTLSFGSSVSRSQSPSRLTLSAVRASAAPGNAASHHATYRKSRLSDSMLPQAGVGGCTPNPRKLIAASATMKDENWRLATTMMEGTTFGRTCPRDDDDGGHDVRQDVPEQEAEAAHPERRCRLHEIALLDGQHLAAHDASIHDPSGGRKAEDDVPEPEAHDGVDGHGEQDERERELDVGQTHEQSGRPPLDEPRDEAEHPADGGGDHHGADADEEREPRAMEDAR